jgi:hypothetical protein
MTKRRVLVVGGKDYNVPTWARRAFVIDLIDADTNSGNATLNPPRADVIVVQVNYCSHNFSGQAHELGRKWGVPVLKARDGWSSAVAHAARNKVDWFVDAVQLAGQRLETKNPPQAEEALEAVENAWKETAQYEREKAAALAIRMTRLEAKLEKVSDAYDRIRSGAEQRVLAAIQQQRAVLKRQATDDGEWARVEVGMMKEAVEAVYLRLERLEQHLQEGVSSDPSEGADGLSQSGGRRG